jgi:16S rRNA (uracil1498-N3)-methyltransferase
VKQCGRSVIPSIPKPTNLEELLSTYTNNSILVCHESGKDVIDVLPKILKKKSKILFLVGPEGGFSKAEIDFLKERNVNFINLGNRRLRSETAVITALSQINIFNN